MAEVTGVRWTPNDGDPIVFEHARTIQTDGHGDYVFVDETGETVATRKKAKTDNVERVYGDHA